MDLLDMIIVLLVVALLWSLVARKGGDSKRTDANAERIVAEPYPVARTAGVENGRRKVTFDSNEHVVPFRKDLPSSMIGVERLAVLKQREARRSGKRERTSGCDGGRALRMDDEGKNTEKQVGTGSMVEVVAKDGKKYKVIDGPYKEQVADYLAEIRHRVDVMIYHLKNLLARGPIVFEGEEITKCMRRLVRKHDERGHTFSELWDPSSDSVAANTDKGAELEICARDKYEPSKINNVNTAMRVALHELAHSADKYYRLQADHGEHFYRLHSFLLKEAQNVGVYSCKQYSIDGPGFCGLSLPDDDASCDRSGHARSGSAKTSTSNPVLDVAALGSMVTAPLRNIL